MHVTDIDTDKAPRDHRPDGCLHCVLMTALEEWFQRHGRREDGKVVIDVIHATSKLQECVVELVGMGGDRSDRRRAMRFAHDALDAALKSKRTGKLVAVDVPEEQ